MLLLGIFLAKWSGSSITREKCRRNSKKIMGERERYGEREREKYGERKREGEIERDFF